MKYNKKFGIQTDKYEKYETSVNLTDDEQIKLCKSKEIMKVNNDKYTMTSNKTICEHKLMKSEKYTGSFLLIEIFELLIRGIRRH